MLQNTGPEEAINRQQQAAALEQWVLSSGLAERLGSAEDRSNFVASLDGNQFVGLLQEMNAILLNQQDSPITTEINVAHNKNTLETLDVMPAPEDKRRLLHTLLDFAQELEDPTDQSTVIGFGINAIHPFDDGNGRVARALYLLLSRDYQPGQDRLLAALGENGDTVANLDANLYTAAIYEMVKSDLQSHTFDQITGQSTPKILPAVRDGAFLNAEQVKTSRRQFDADAFYTMRTMFMDGHVGPILAHLLADGQQNLRIIRTATTQKQSGKTIFYVDDFLTHASDTEMDQAYQYFRDLKIQYIQRLLEVLAGKGEYGDALLQHPEKAPGQGITFLALGKLAAERAIDTHKQQ